MRITGDNPEGKAQLDNFIDVNEKYPTVVTTSKLMTTGVDCKTCKLIVLENNISSMTEFKQIIGRGTRLNPKYGKEYFTIMDFRDACRLFADPEFDGDPIPPEGEGTHIGGKGAGTPTPQPSEGNGTESEPKQKVRIHGVDVEILSERVQYYDKDGRLIVESLKDYTKRNILEKYATLDVFLRKWNETAKKTASVELAPGKDGMVHISQVCNERIDAIEPHLHIGDEVIVKVIKIDDKGRVNLTIKGVSEEEKAQFN